MEFKTIVTKVGLAKIAKATATGKKVDIKYMAFGDGGGKYPNINDSMTALVSEKHRGKTNNVQISDENNIKVSKVIPASVGGFYVREIGIFDSEEDLIAIGVFPETYKPTIEDGVTKDIVANMVITVSNTDSIHLKVDPNIIVATITDLEELRIEIDELLASLQLSLDEADFEKIKEIVSKLNDDQLAEIIKVIKNSNAEQLQEILDGMALEDTKGNKYKLEIYEDGEALKETFSLQTIQQISSLGVTDDYITNIEVDPAVTDSNNVVKGNGKLVYYNIETGIKEIEKQLGQINLVGFNEFDKAIAHPSNINNILHITHSSNKTDAKRYSYGVIDNVNCSAITQYLNRMETMYCKHTNTVFELGLNNNLLSYNTNRGTSNTHQVNIINSSDPSTVFMSKEYVGKAGNRSCTVCVKYNNFNKTIKYTLKSAFEYDKCVYCNRDNNIIYMGGVGRDNTNTFYIDSIDLGDSLSNEDVTVPSRDVKQVVSFRVGDMNTEDLNLKYIDDEYILLMGKEQQLVGSSQKDFFVFYLLDRKGNKIGERKYLTHEFADRQRNKINSIQIFRKNNRFVALNQYYNAYCIVMQILPERKIRLKEVE